MNFFLKISYVNFTTVDFPFEPVIPMIGDFVNQYPNSISLTIGILYSFIFFTIEDLFGLIPGLIITKSDSRHFLV